MAFVILSTGSITRSRLRTLRVRTLLLGIAALLALAVTGGLRLGYEFGAMEASAAMPLPILANFLERPEGRALADRIGALSARMMQLETEARTLAASIGIVQDVEKRFGSQGAATRQGTAATTPRTQPALPTEPSGGPFVPASEPMPSPVTANIAQESDLARIERDLDQLTATLALLAAAATPRAIESMAFPARLPIDDRRISSGFGTRIDPFTRRAARHMGIDMPAPRNAPIRAAGGGRVTFAGYRSAYGYMVEIDHGNGLSTRYAHASRLMVRRDQIVLPEQQIAIVGSTGRSTGAHLHFEVLRRGVQIEPSQFLRPLGT